MRDDERERFDGLVEEAIDALPESLREKLEEVPLIVEDRPGGALLDELVALWGLEEGETPESFAGELCGLHTGIALTERSVEQEAALPDEIRLFRDGIVSLAGGWDQPEADDAVYEEIMITLLHEMGHHFGLGEEDLADLGYD